jgi:aminocarboxymuconate-semialdehyde decarboxylase
MQLHTCDSGCAPNCDIAKIERVKADRGARPLTIDLHCHALVPEVEKLVAGLPGKLAEADVQFRGTGEASADHNTKVMLPAAVPKLITLELRLQDMEKMGVDVQVVSPSPTQYYYWADVDLARDIVRLQNEKIAALCEQHPTRLAGLGAIALQHPDLCIEQLTHAVKVLGFKGVEISTSVCEQELSDPKFARFWAKAEELGCVVFIHPFGTSLGARLNRHYLSNIIGQPIETTIALSYLIFGGTLDRHPGLKIVAAHGGGYLPTYIGRSNHGNQVRPEAGGIQLKPADYLKRIWFDSIVYEPQELRRLIDAVGASQVVLGTDYPFDMGHYDVHDLMASVPGLSEADRINILGGNAARLLGIHSHLAK